MAWQEAGGSQGNSAWKPRSFLSAVGRKGFDLMNQMFLGAPAGGRSDSVASASVSEISQPIEAKSEKEVSNKVAGGAIGEASSTLSQADGADESSTSAGNEQEQLTALSEADIIEKKEADFKRDFLAGKIRTIISLQKQNRHIKGRNEFAKYVETLARTGDVPSYIREDLTMRGLKTLVVDKLRGDVIYTPKGPREYVQCNEVVGYYYSKRQGKYIATRCALVIYALGDGNIHIVPVKESEDN